MFISLLQKRRSFRKFLKQKVEAEKIGQIIEAALRSPSGGGKNPWEFIVVTDEALLGKLSVAKEHGSAIGIGHPHPTTLAVLKHELSKLESSGVKLIPASQLVRMQHGSEHWYASMHHLPKVVKK